MHNKQSPVIPSCIYSKDYKLKVGRSILALIFLKECETIEIDLYIQTNIISYISYKDGFYPAIVEGVKIAIKLTKSGVKWDHY